MDKLHKVSHQLVYDCDIIVLEDLNVKGWLRTINLLNIYQMQAGGLL